MSGRRLSGRSALRSAAASLLATVALGGCLAGPTPTPPSSSTPSTVVEPTPGPSALGTAPSPSAPSAPSATSARATIDPAAVRGLLVLTNQAVASRLELIDDHGVAWAVPLPDPAVSWISTDPAGHILATTRAGRAFLSGRVAADGATTWQRLRLSDIAHTRLAGPIVSGTLSPDGNQAAFVAADLSTGQPFDVVVVDTRTGAGRVVGIDLGFGGPAPAWLGRKLLLLTRGTDDHVGSTVVDSLTGVVTQGPGPGRAASSTDTTAWRDEIAALVASADGRTVAVVSRTTGRMKVIDGGAWLNRDGAGGVDVPLGPAPGGFSPEIIWTLALSPAAERLALVRTDTANEPIAVTIHAASAGWVEVARIPVAAGTGEVALAWLP